MKNANGTLILATGMLTLLLGLSAQANDPATLRVLPPQIKFSVFIGEPVAGPRSKDFATDDVLTSVSSSAQSQAERDFLVLIKDTPDLQKQLLFNPALELRGEKVSYHRNGRECLTHYVQTMKLLGKEATEAKMNELKAKISTGIQVPIENIRLSGIEFYYVGKKSMVDALNQGNCFMRMSVEATPGNQRVSKPINFVADLPFTERTESFGIRRKDKILPMTMDRISNKLHEELFARTGQVRAQDKVLKSYAHE